MSADWHDVVASHRSEEAARGYARGVVGAFLWLDDIAAGLGGGRMTAPATKRAAQPLPEARFNGEALLSRAQLMVKFQVRKSALHKLTTRPTFPPASREFGPPRWVESEVDAWIREQVTIGRAGRRPRAVPTQGEPLAPPPTHPRAESAPREPRGRTGTGRRRT